MITFFGFGNEDFVPEFWAIEHKQLIISRHAVVNVPNLFRLNLII